MDKRVKFGAGFVLICLVGSVSLNILSILNPSASKQRIVIEHPIVETPEIPDTSIKTPDVISEYELEREMAYKNLATACMISLEEEIEEMEFALVDSRARRFENYAQMEAERLGISTNEFLIQQYNETKNELIELTRYGTLPTTADETRKFRDLVGKLKDIKLALTGRPEGKRNIPATRFARAMTDCGIKAIIYNNLNTVRQQELMDRDW
jgi:hypothetical protein